MRLLHHYPTLSHSYLRNATRLFGFRETYRLVDVHASQRKKKTAVFHNEKNAVFTMKKNAAFYNEKRPLSFTMKRKTATFYNEKRPPRFTTEKTATFHNGAVSSENTN